MNNLQVWEILVPTRLNGKRITARTHRVWDAKVREVSGGLTILQATKGQWVSPSKEVCMERMIPVRIACTRAQIEQLADMTASYYHQDAVMFYCISNEVIIRCYQ